MDLVIASPNGDKQKVIDDYNLDLEFGIGLGNDFRLEGINDRLPLGSRIWIPNTEYGGIIDDDNPSRTVKGDAIYYHGRTWQGILQGNIVSPDRGQDYLTLSGTCNNLLKTLIERSSLSDIFTVLPAGSPYIRSYKFNRYIDLYTAIRDMLLTVGQRLEIKAVDGGVVLCSKEITDWGDLLGTENVAFSAKRNNRPVNHLICLGKGELKEREVVHFYADEDGNISQTQSLFGIDHVGQVYDISSKSGSELVSAGRSKLKKLQEDKNTAKAVLPDAVGMSVGDSVTAISTTYGVKAKANITGVVLKIQGGLCSVTPKADGRADTVDYT
ncbi:MAG: hypothetical protein KHZ79_06260 [Atopobium minutum]|uniref:hypothetical protein n=1 Tax=Atopobium minutum TaxID=1381 RepID=UPI001E0A4F32|nr:hypothetical protein [Atopobium minutum]MBS4873958.1 hypothetical protein [Atopobium minutum]